MKSSSITATLVNILSQAKMNKVKCRTGHFLDAEASGSAPLSLELLWYTVLGFCEMF